MESELNYYSTHSPITDPGAHADLFPAGPVCLGELTRLVRNVQFHEAYAEAALLKLPDDAVSDPRTCDAALRFVDPMLERILARDSRPLSFERSKKKCFIGTCRDYAVLLCSILREQGIPARVRCGFASYFSPEGEFWDDHWVTEIWNDGEGRWQLVDAEIDHTLPQHKHIEGDPLNVPRSLFQVAGQAWKAVRFGSVPAECFGVGAIGIKGEWFVAASVVRDLACLNRFEMLPFDEWGIAHEIGTHQRVSDEERELIDRLADLTSGESVDFQGLRQIFTDTDALRVTDPIYSYPKGVETEYSLGFA